MATLTYVYADSTAVVGPLATYAEPHCYDLCEAHAQRLTAPRGWEVVRHEEDPDRCWPAHDDLKALADAVREAARPPAPCPPARRPAVTHRPARAPARGPHPALTLPPARRTRRTSPIRRLRTGPYG